MNQNKNITTTDDVLVKVEGLSKKFCKDLKTGLWYGLKDLVSRNPGAKDSGNLRPKEFWAVKDVSFELRRGECLGLIGHNGAGKSTLLKILNGLINPDGGKVTIRGRVGALIELGAGFNPILTGRENVYNNGAILGFSRKEIDAKLEEIIAFAELEEFIDMPVQHYSSGMKVRLGFAVAAQMEPDVLLIDEVLAVGDLGFVLKCFKAIDTILPRTAIVFVSHNMPMVSRICNQVVLLDHGKVEYQGKNVGEGIDLYYKRFAQNESKVLFDDGTIEIKNIQLISSIKTNDGLPILNWNDEFKLKFKILTYENIDMPKFLITLFDKEQRSVAVLKSNEINSPIEFKKDRIEFILSHKNLQLTKGIYSINVLVSNMETGVPLLRVHDILSFQLVDKEDYWPPFLLDATYSEI
ncbi:ABC transporter ATP-binding protein [Aestuariivivens insulae]|uniref:ABC transporter ATP-binding protein n=1 Tax=Aestuariivivens insulae TaxID=1621988 RepID=UPI001F5AE5F3|nr:ABC transporter ATP-binding protein [Aestuariivivens insulae]